MALQESNVYTQEVVNGLSVIITGGTTGIGRATALLLASHGANVFVNGTDQQHLDDLLADVASSNLKGSVKGTIADLATEDGVNGLFEEAGKYLNGVDMFINNAALAYQGVADGEYSEWHKVVNTNLTGYIACTHTALQKMKDVGSGHIVNVGSMSADVREKDSSVYVATKAAIQGFTESLRKEVNEQGIKVTLIEPGAVGTDMQPVSVSDQQDNQKNLEMLKAEDIANVILFTLSQPKRCDIVDIKVKPHLQII
ncbi:SDR family oxidoreductase [Mucilaginibacter pallidiroseus]|uniref:SDR family oxidoreductase n=1 Tax=Mucilaginibacter pallidiroseus TaxID=2599295 RepID=A0A563UHQ4_9SPHI|nr:SDR family oxidoreductase [Mucilaginibacter pallidiroseus]TWR30922.1 SDR family oxidoreductase [Mucilaginibacter pallidiroseus]